MSVWYAQDFDSPKLKRKHHWNSFTTPFFLHLDAVKAELRSHGRVEVNRAQAEQLLKEDLRCQWCKAAFKTMPKLKAHIVACNSFNVKGA